MFRVGHPLSWKRSAGSDKEEDEERPSKLPKKRLGEDVNSHRQELEELKRSDPEFYKFLQDTDAELLHFEDEEEPEPGAGSDSDEEGIDEEGHLDKVSEVWYCPTRWNCMVQHCTDHGLCSPRCAEGDGGGN